jgi:cyanophycin synthetase
MRVVSRSVYLGPSLYAHFKVIRFTVDLGELEQHPTGKLGEAFIGPLLEALPGLHDHGCSYGEPGGFVRRLREDEGTWLGHVFEHVAIELQNVAGARVTFGRTRGTGTEGEYDVVYEYENEEVGLEAGRLGLALLRALLPEELQVSRSDADFNFEEERDDFIRFAQRRALGPSTAALLRAAEERDIPHLRLNQYSLVQLGHGRHQRRIQATVTSETKHIAVELASDKEETNRLLGDLGLPVAQQRLIRSEDAAAAAAESIGYPVVVKPLNANHGRGVSIKLQTPEEVRTAFHQAREHSRSVLVESYIEGLDHRLLVVDGELVAASKRVPGHVVGDGESTIEQLVDEVNEDPRRGIGHEKLLTRLEFDYQAERLLESAGLKHESVPAAGEIVYLRSTGNLSTGGTAVDVTDQVHPDVREMAVRAAQAIGLDVCGVDFLTTDVARSWSETKGAICELNAAPGFRMHVAPSEGTPRDVAGPVMDMLFPPGSDSRIPVVSITGTNGKTTTSRMVAHVLKLAGHTVGLATTDGVYIDGQRTVEGDMTGPVSARMILRDPTVDVAVLETARGGLLRRGMGYRHPDVGAVLNVAADHLGLRGIETIDQLADVKRVVVEVARDTAVLNADDERCLRMADHTQATNVCYVTMNTEHPLVREHIKAGGRACVLEEGMAGQMLTIYDQGTHSQLLWAHLIPATLDGRAVHNVQNAMFAAAICHAMGVKLEDIRHGLRTFDTTFFQAPGRLNVFDDHPFKVVLDYAHNPAAVQAMVELACRLDVRGRRVVVLAAPGDRRDEDVQEIARIAAGKFDRYYCRRDDQLRGRQSDEVPLMLRASLIEAGVPEEQVFVVPSEEEAVNRALTEAEPDDLVLLFGDDIQRTWDQVVGFQAGDAAPTATTQPGEEVSVPPAPPPVPAAALGEELIRDERGVRLARREPEGDD